MVDAAAARLIESRSSQAAVQPTKPPDQGVATAGRVVSPNEPKHNHYIPQHYQRGFCAEDLPGLLWVYTKGRSDVYQAGIHKIAKQKDYYLPHIEKALAHHLESTTEPILKKVRARRPIDDSERFAIAAYVIILQRRVPRHRQTVDGMIPGLMEDRFAAFRAALDDDSCDVTIRERRRAEIDELEKRWKGGLPEDLVQRLHQPITTGMVEAYLMKMHWYFLVAAGRSRFVTCDNPVYLHKGLGLNKPESELSCPLSSDVALLVTATARNWAQYVEVPEMIVQEINRRSVENATRQVYYFERAVWLERMVQKRILKLNRIGP